MGPGVRVLLSRVSKWRATLPSWLKISGPRIGTWSSGIIVPGVKMAGNSPQLVEKFGTSNWDLEFWYCPGCQNGRQISPIGWNFRDIELGPAVLVLSGVSKGQITLPNWLEFSGHRIGIWILGYEAQRSRGNSAAGVWCVLLLSG